MANFSIGFLRYRRILAFSSRDHRVRFVSSLVGMMYVGYLQRTRNIQTQSKRRGRVGDFFSFYSRFFFFFNEGDGNTIASVKDAFFFLFCFLF